MSQFYTRFICYLFASLVFGGCALIPSTLEPPRLTLTNIELQDATLFEQQYRLTLRVQNPNDYDLDIKGMRFDLEINGEEFASGVSNEAINVPGYGEAMTSVAVTSTLASILRQFQELSQSEALAYRFKGKIKIGTFGAPVPFDYQGALTLKPGNDTGTKSRSI
ncbi:MAG: LEA type 2 family protein [Gammaproteobacteria bacterium]|nr:LEA type 2 family protein [Gammaproteobacteria bacterium]